MKFDAPSYVFLVLMLGVGPIALFGWLGGWIGELVSYDGAAIGSWMGLAAGLAIFLAALASFVRHDRRRRARVKKDVAAISVQDLVVAHPRVVQLGVVGVDDPILAFDVGGGQLLALMGQWLIDPHTYGAKNSNGDFDERFANGLPAPLSFPSTQFTVTRLPNSGRVLAIRTGGEYLAPEKSEVILDPLVEHFDSQLVDGTLDQLAVALSGKQRPRLGK